MRIIAILMFVILAIGSVGTTAIADDAPALDSTKADCPTPEYKPAPTPTKAKTNKRGLAKTGSRPQVIEPRCDEKQVEVSADYRQRIFDLTNAERRKAKLPEFEKHECLHNSAQYWSGRQAEERQMYHSDMGQLMSTCKLAGVGENVAVGYSTPEGMVNAWMASPGHRANILNPSFTRIGTGWAYGYGTQMFGM